MMEIVVQPKWQAPGDWVGSTEALARVPDVDEDELTLAVEATQRLLAASHTSPLSIQEFILRCPTQTGLASAFAQALGVGAERVKENPLAPEATASPAVWVEVRVCRPGRPHAGSTSARARLLPGSPGPVVHWGGEARPLPRETADKMARWETEAPLRVPMGAYVPKPTWDRSIAARYRLEAAECVQGHIQFPPRRHCPRCLQPTKPVRLASQGVLETFTGVAPGAGPSEFEPLQDVGGEYVVGVARFGPCRVPGIMIDVDPKRLRIGMGVEPVLRRLYAQEGSWRYGVKFRPVGLLAPV